MGKVFKLFKLQKAGGMEYFTVIFVASQMTGSNLLIFFHMCFEFKFSLCASIMTLRFALDLLCV